MDSINGIPLIWDNEGDKNLFGKLFQTQTDNFLVNQNPVTNSSSTFKSPFSESQRPTDGSFLKLDQPLSIFQDDFSYTIFIEKLKTGSEVLDAYNNRSVADYSIVFFCEETNPNKSNLFKTFVLVKFGAKYKSLLYKLKSANTTDLVSRIKGTNTGVAIKNFEDEVNDNFNRITKGYKIDVEIDTIRFVMENELQVTSATNKTIAELYSWYNNGVSFVVDGMNGWLEELKFSRTDYLPTPKEDNSNNLLDNAIKGIDYLIPNEIEKFISNTLENALTQIKEYAKENLPQTWVAFLKRIYDTIKGYLNFFKQYIEKIGELVGEAFLLGRALLMGFANGLISTVQTLLSLIGWLLKTNGYKKLTGESYKDLNSKLEFIEDFLDLVSEKATDFFNAVDNLINDFSLEKIKNTLKVFGNKFKDLNSYDYAFFAGSLIFEVVLGVILAIVTEGASLFAQAANAAEKQAAFFKLLLREFISTATMGVVDILRLFKVLIAKFAQACKNGWKGFKNFLEEILVSKSDNLAKEEEKLRTKIDDFIDDYNKGNSKLSEVFFSDIIKNLDGVTEQSTLVAKAAEEGLLGKKILSDDIFNSFYESITGKSAKKVSAFARNNICHFRESTPIEIFFKEFVHEGTHVKDNASKIGNNLKKLIADTENIILEGEKMTKYIKDLNKDQLIEFRARIFEREFEITLKLELDFKSIDEMITFIKKHY